MFKRFLSGNSIAKEVKNLTYRNSRILILRDEQKTALPFEARIDLSRENIRFKTANDALAHAMAVIDASREALFAEQSQSFEVLAAA